MNPDGTSNTPPFKDLSKEQMELTKQLMQVVAKVRHIDELLQWVANAFVEHFDIQLLQFWTNQANPDGRLAPLLRMVAHRDASIPEQVAANTQMAPLVQYVMNARRSYRAQTIESLVPTYQTMLLRRYGLYNCGACFISKNVYLPPLERMFSYDQLPTPLTMVALFFVRHASQIELLAAISMTLEQVLTLAENRGLLTNTDYGAGMQMPGYGANIQMPGFGLNVQQLPVTPQVPVPESIFPLEQLVPRRKQNADLMLSSNPFVGKVTITDKNARRLQGAIDGSTNVAGLCSNTGMSMKEVHIALQLLLSQQYIEIYDPDGHPVKKFPFI